MKTQYIKPNMKVVRVEMESQLMQASPGGSGKDIPLQVKEEEMWDIW